jgi:alginate O-acetyltransferase complex protein AlgI
VQCVGVAHASVNASFSMLFNSWNFLVFMAVLLPLYYAPSASAGWQLALLLAASAVFYAWESPWLLGLLIGSSSVSVFAAQQIVANRWAAPSPGAQPSGTLAAARRWLWLGVSINLLALLLFKYAPLLSALAPEWMLPSPARDWALAIPLPVGISFYTFQGISLIVDAWRGDLPAATKASLAAHGLGRSTSFRDATFYLLFFPQLVAGPIVKAHDFLPQIGRKTRRDIDWLTARRALVTGFFLKMVVADNLAEQTVPLALGTAGDMSMGALNLLALIYAYSLQIFADFAGYSLIAIGLSSLFGYTLSANFNFPYLATTITDFWRRWHLSLSSWLREYLYIPLGGNRRGDVRTYVNLFIVMFLGGLWHGAAWKYALWGTLHGVFLAVVLHVSRRDAALADVRHARSACDREMPTGGGLRSARPPRCPGLRVVVLRHAGSSLSCMGGSARAVRRAGRTVAGLDRRTGNPWHHGVCDRDECRCSAWLHLFPVLSIRSADIHARHAVLLGVHHHARGLFRRTDAASPCQWRSHTEGGIEFLFLTCSTPDRHSATPANHAAGFVDDGPLARPGSRLGRRRKSRV